ncbi:MAG: hypothetical protein EOO62_10380, partial [Hymenobacter sp.]
MNTLKLKLLAASMFACSAAFAQNAPASMRPTITDPNAPNPTPAYNNNRSTYANDSYVLQQGLNQYAKVDQSGNGPGNTADILQGVNGGGGNNATQTQTSAGTPGRNTAYIAQDGFTSSASQTQTGRDNVADIEQQTGSHNNYAAQIQDGAGDRALITQSGNTEQAVQKQTGGNSNYANTS